MQLQGSLYVVAAPSGGGKTSLVRALLDDVENIAVSVSHTTRPKRPNETEGQDYYFIDDDKFNKMLKNNEFVEHATVFGHSYGTSKAQIENRLNQGIDMLFDIDWQGARQLTQLFERVETVFILPPSLETLHERLTNRGQDKAKTITERMNEAKEEMSHYQEFDYLIINNAFDAALNELKSIVYANRLRQSSQAIRHQKLLSNLLS